MIKRRIFSFFYDSIFFLGVIVYLPVYFKRKKITWSAFKEKCAVYPEKARSIAPKNRKVVWIQVVSVGEVTLIRSLVEYLKAQGESDVVISVTTLTGRKVAEKMYPGNLVVYLPFDISFLIRRAIRFIKPAVFVAIETEIWPNLYLQLKRENVPVIILNGRISERAFAQYRKIKFFMKKILNLAECIGVQNQFYKERFLELGADIEKTIITGNLKFSNYSIDEKKYAAFVEKYYPYLKNDDSLLFLAASTHAPEETYALDCYKTLIVRYPNLRLMVVPRHIERVDEIERIFAAAGFRTLKLSEGFKGGTSSQDVFVVDTVGDLLACYSMADFCFVGGSLADYGGHNILEPLYFAKPTLFGPCMSNFKEIEQTVLDHQAGIQVAHSEDLRERLEELIQDVSYRQKLSGNAHAIFTEGQETLKNSVACIRRWLY
ncbi:MAG: 3-deoxy-D-manno-octulosonic acid transferase [Candidatus Omnitrophica bacterium]|nr:3-deoxy-D-manno-octulosonic acid transferase [Candidatus Omnitrophota bacterium]